MLECYVDVSRPLRGIITTPDYFWLSNKFYIIYPSFGFINYLLVNMAVMFLMWIPQSSSDYES